MINNYEGPEVVEMGRARKVLLGSCKLCPIFPDSPNQPDRENQTGDDE